MKYGMDVCKVGTSMTKPQIQPKNMRYISGNTFKNDDFSKDLLAISIMNLVFCFRRSLQYQLHHVEVPRSISIVATSKKIGNAS